MSEHIDRLCGELRIKLHGIDRRLEALKGNAMATSEKSQHAVESHLDRVEQRIFENRAIVETANGVRVAPIATNRRHRIGPAMPLTGASFGSFWRSMRACSEAARCFVPAFERIGIVLAQSRAGRDRQ